MTTLARQLGTTLADELGTTRPGKLGTLAGELGTTQMVSVEMEMILGMLMEMTSFQVEIQVQEGLEQGPVQDQEQVDQH